VYAIAAAPIGMPGCPELACSTASAERKRIVLIARFSSDLSFIGTAPFLWKPMYEKQLDRHSRLSAIPLLIITFRLAALPITLPQNYDFPI
jgi:hypothetical protein